ncbi:polar amino acid transport system substrate-binding protein [Paraburkholderia sp. EB58]|jgi:polar amino acid transport system substrate-binding protein|uniref:ABC transporter substrate-binding protein n=1 Tax=Paraburkholderia sp. EB58 TaxID=3035125 RepID=UPI003D201C11
MKFSWKLAASALALALSGLVASPAFAETSLTKLLPQSVRDAGVLRVVAAESGPPMLYLGKDVRTVEGMEADLTQAVADALGVKLEYTMGTFDSLIPAITAGRADLAVGSIGDLKSREPQVDFVDYVKAGIGMATLKGNANGITDVASLCGKQVAVIRGTFQEKELHAQQEKCQASGKPLEVQTFADPNGAALALRSGRVDVWSGDSAAIGYDVSQYPSTLQLAGEMHPIALLGYAVSKQNTQLRDAIKAALEAVQKSGKYKQIFDKWGQGATMVDKFTVNDAWL